MMFSPDHGTVDVAVVGAGFGGLSAALALAEQGAKVVLLERLRYPGGCASTFRRSGRRHEAGATLFSGLGEGQVFGRWVERYALPVTIDWLDPAVELRTPGRTIRVPARRDELVRTFVSMAGAHGAAVERFFELQRRVADVLWELFDDPSLLPPLRAGAIARHVGRSPRYLVLLPLLGRSLVEVLRRFGLDGFEPLRTYLDAVCQITVQASAQEAEAPFALAAMDYYFRGTGHVRGGIGELAEGLVSAIRSLGGQVRLSTEVHAVRFRPTEGAFALETRRGRLLARQVVANLLPQAARELLGLPRGASRTLDRLAERVETGWGAVMLYGVARAPGSAPREAKHLELVADPKAPFVEGNHVFLSIRGEDDANGTRPGERPFTASTHVDLAKLLRSPEEDRARTISRIQARMRETLTSLAPEWAEGLIALETASPRTFERFTGRPHGFVGGIPRRVGREAYRGIGPVEVVPGFHLVGDTVFPGQSTLGVAIGGLRLAEAIFARSTALAPVAKSPVRRTASDDAPTNRR